MPPIQIRRPTKEILNNFKALIDGYTMIPVYNYYIPTMADDLNQNGCPYLRDCFNFYYNDPGSYGPEGSYVLPLMKDKIGKAF